MEKSKSNWEALCRQILATITLEANKEKFAAMPESWHNLVSIWTDEFHILVETDQRMAVESALILSSIAHDKLEKP